MIVDDYECIAKEWQRIQQEERLADQQNANEPAHLTDDEEIEHLMSLGDWI